MFNASITIITIITMLTMGGSQHTTPPNYHHHTNIHKFQTQESFEKIYYKCIPQCSFNCFELSFRPSRTLQLLILTCGAIISSKSRKYWYKSLSGKNHVTALYIPGFHKFLHLVLSVFYQDTQQILSITTDVASFREIALNFKTSGVADEIKRKHLVDTKYNHKQYQPQ